MSAAAKGTPRFRFALLLALASGVLISAWAFQEAAVAFSIEQLKIPQPTLGPFARLVPYAKEQELALQAQERARFSAIEGMSTPRGLSQGLLSLCGLLMFLGAAQIRWAGETPWVGLADRLAWICRGGAVLRTLAGAQDLVIVRRATEASARVLEKAAIPDAQVMGEFTRLLVTVISVGWMVVVVGLLVGLGAYFRNPEVQRANFAPDAPE